PGRHRQGIPGRDKKSRRSPDGNERPHHFYTPDTGRRPCYQRSSPVDTFANSIYRGRSAYGLWPRRSGYVPAYGKLRGQNSQGRQASRSAGRAADEIRAGDQFENSQADRSDNSTERAGESG